MGKRKLFQVFSGSDENTNSKNKTSLFLEFVLKISTDYGLAFSQSIEFWRSCNA